MNPVAYVNPNDLAKAEWTGDIRTLARIPRGKFFVLIKGNRGSQEVPSGTA